MIKILFTIIIIFLFSACNNYDQFPKTLTDEIIKNEFGNQFYRYYGSYIQKEDGEYTKTQGVFFFDKTEKGLVVAIYLPTNSGYQLLASPFLVPDTDKATASNDPNINVPLYKVYGESTYYIYVENGKIKKEKR